MRLQKVISNLKPELTQVGRYQVVRISQEWALRELDPRTVDAIIVENESSLKAVLSNDSLYLKPTFHVGATNKECDGIYEVDNPSAIISKIEVLEKSIGNYKDLSFPSDAEDRLLTKILRYLISRKKVLQPINSRKSSIGYSFPLVEDMSIESNPLHIIKHLNDFAAQDYFSRNPIDKVNICYDCNSSYLNFSECCSKCNSLDLKTEELVHHFRCAYVGPQTDFMKDDRMVCPKCDHHLKHIGIDYDKPSEIHTCKSCNHSSQETKMKAKCVDCSKENELDQLVTYDIHQYRPTEKAISKSTQSDAAQSFGKSQAVDHEFLLNHGAFNLIKSHESKRTHAPHLATYQMITSIDASVISGLNGGMQIALLQELAAIMKPYLKHNDLLSIDSDLNIHGLLIDYTDQDNAAMQDALHYNLNKMLRDNGWSDQNTVMITSTKLN